MSTILVIDDTAFWRDLAADGLRLLGHVVVTAADGIEGLAELKASNAELVVLDVGMPRLEGFAFLEQIRRELKWKHLPVIMLTGDMQKDQVMRAARLGAVDYLLKAHFSLSELVLRVKRRLSGTPGAAESAVQPESAVSATDAGALAPPFTVMSRVAEIRPLISRDQAIDRAMAALAGRTLSGAVSQVITLAGSPRMDAAEVAQLVGHDPLLAARVTAAASKISAASNHGPVCSLHEAVRMVGSSTVQNIASSIGVYDAMPEAEPDGYNPIMCWQHSVAVARLCDQLAAPEMKPMSYLMGLCHDLGEILFRTHFGMEFRQVLSAVEQINAPRAELESQLMGITHAELVQMILTELALPDSIHHPIAAFHAAMASGGSPVTPQSRLLLIGEEFSAALRLGSGEAMRLRPLSKIECKSAMASENPPPIDYSSFRTEVFVLTAQCARLPARDLKRLMTPPPARLKQKVLLVRDASFSGFDPIATLLAELVELEVKSRLPAAKELAEYAGLIVLAKTFSQPGMTVDDVRHCVAVQSGNSIKALYLAAKGMPTDNGRADSVMCQAWPTPVTVLEHFVNRL